MANDVMGIIEATQFREDLPSFEPGDTIKCPRSCYRR